MFRPPLATSVDKSWSGVSDWLPESIARDMSAVTTLGGASCDCLKQRE